MAVTPGAYAVDGIGEGDDGDGDYDMYDTNWDDNATLNTNLAVSGPGSVGGVGSSHHHPARSMNTFSSSMPPISMESGEAEEFAEGDMEQGFEQGTSRQQDVANILVADVTLASKNEEGGPQKKTWIMIGGGLLLCIIVVIIVVVVLMTGPGGGGDPEPDSTIPVVTERSIALTNIFSAIVVDPAALSREGSLERQANEWVYTEDTTPLNNVEKVRVRFALILLYLNINPTQRHVPR
jgi:hypothetical protein